MVSNHAAGPGEADAALEPQGSRAAQHRDLQRRVQGVLLEALRAWRMGGFDSAAIKVALEHIQLKIQRFEANVGELHAAASSKVWLSIKEAISGVLQHAVAEYQNGESNAGTRKLPDTSMRRLERQSGIQGLSWDRRSLRWRIARRETGKRRDIYFPIHKCLGCS